MDEQLEEEELEEEESVIAAISAFLGATTVLKFYERKEARTQVEISQISRQPHVNRDIDEENYINSMLLCRDAYCIDQIGMSPMAFLDCVKLLKGGDFSCNHYAY